MKSNLFRNVSLALCATAVRDWLLDIGAAERDWSVLHALTRERHPWVPLNFAPLNVLR